MGRRWITGFIVMVLLVAGGFLAFGDRLVSGQGPATPPPEATELPAVTASDEIVADGKVVPVRSAALSLSTGGIVADVPVTEGERVEAGQVLVRLEAAQQEAAVAQAEAGLRSAQARLEELKAGPREQEIAAARAAVEAAQAQLARLMEGARPQEIAAAEAGLAAALAALQKVEEGPDEGQIISAQAEMASAEATLKQAQAAYDQVKWRNDVGALPQAAELERATIAYTAAKARYDELMKGATEADLAQARAAVQEAQAQLEVLRAPARAAEISAAEAEIRRAQAQLELLEAGARPETIAAAEAEVASAEAMLQQARAALAETELRAPFAGVVAGLEAKVGEQVAPGVVLVQLADLSEWQIETDDLTELNVVNIREGDPVTIRFDAIPDLVLPGRVSRIEAIGENKQGDITYTVVIRPEQQDERLRWNMTATVTIDPANE